MGANWPLNSSLDRIAIQRGWPKKRALLEVGLLREFQRKAHLHHGALPEAGNIVEWLALMQHYGCPTRLLDFTYSLNVALFFACQSFFPYDTEGKENKAENGEENKENTAAVWAIDVEWLKKRSEAKLRHAGHPDAVLARKRDSHGRKRKTFVRLYDREPPVTFVLPQNAHRLNERSVIQQGVFLCPGDPEHTFQDNLAAIQENRDHDKVCKLLIPASKANDILKELHAQNMNSAVLFPGLQGLAESLAELTVLPNILCPDTLERIRNQR